MWDSCEQCGNPAIACPTVNTAIYVYDDFHLITVYYDYNAYAHSGHALCQWNLGWGNWRYWQTHLQWQCYDSVLLSFLIEYLSELWHLLGVSWGHLHWFGHLQRMDLGKWPRKILTHQADSTYSQVRPSKCWEWLLKRWWPAISTNWCRPGTEQNGMDESHSS